MTENSPLFGSRPGADALRSASAAQGDTSDLQKAANCSLILTEASILRISVGYWSGNAKEHRRLL